MPTKCKTSLIFLLPLLLSTYNDTAYGFGLATAPNYQSSTTSSPTTTSRQEFLQNIGLVAPALAVTTLISAPDVVEARGRATLEQAYDRYAPRIIAGGEFYTKDLKAILGQGDFVALRDATAEPPKRTKEDKSKVDGGIAQRAAKAGNFSDARVLTACDLFAATFSDNSISTKTKAMKDQVEIMRKVVKEMNTSAKLALGEEKAGGGVFGLGAKKPSPTELLQNCRKLYVEGGNAYNQYIYSANEGLPVTLSKFPYL